MAEFKRNLAVIIGINSYQNGIQSLKTAAQDACKLAEILQTHHDYQLIHPVSEQGLPILNEAATLQQLRQLLSETLPNQVRPNKDDRLLVYFAGHGITRQTSDKGPQGFIVPQDADTNKPDSLLPMRELYQSLNQLKCRHLLVILDCCFAGMFRWANMRKVVVPDTIHWEHYHRFIKSPAWQVITSAAHNQEALDYLDNRGTGASGKHSPFAEALFEGLLEGKADLIPDGVITAPELYLYLRDSVEKRSKEQQTPGFWPLNKHDRGEYIFQLVADDQLRLKPAPKLEKDNNPYRGLEAFEERHANFFFGREEVTDRLFNHLSTSKQQFTVVTGVSGSGKSSLVRAGLIPHIKIILIEACILSLSILKIAVKYRLYLPLQFLPLNFVDQWKIINPIRPGNEPYLALLKAVDSPDSQKLKPMVTQIKQLPKQLYQLIANWTQQNPSQKCLLVIDQFEELITLGPKRSANRKEQKQNLLKFLTGNKPASSKNDVSDSTMTSELGPQWQQFIALLANALENFPQLHLLITLRSDFEPRFQKSALYHRWASARFKVPPMRSDELREAVIGPANEMALYFDPASLVDLLVDEVVQTPGALPLLSFTLSELYLNLHKAWVIQGKEDRALSVDSEFDGMGGVAGLLARRANSEYRQLPDDQSRATMRQVMLRMVRLEGGEALRRRVLKADLVYSDSEKNKRVERVLTHLDQARLIVSGNESGDAYVEPAHDFLVRGWDRLQDWIREGQEGLAVQDLLTSAAKNWHGSGRKVSDLWDRNSRLDRLKEILEAKEISHNNWFNRIESEFIEHSDQRKKHVRWRDISIVSLMIGVMTILTITAEKRRMEAERQTVNVLNSSSRALSDAGRNFDALLEALKASQQISEYSNLWSLFMKTHIDADQIMTATALTQAIHNTRELNRFTNNAGRILTVAFSQDSQMSASGSADGTVKLWLLDGREVPFPKEHDDIVSVIKFNPDGATLTSASTDGKIVIWNLSGQKIRTAQIEQIIAGNFEFSPDSEMVVSGSSGRFTLSNLDGRMLRTFQGHSGLVLSFSFRPDGEVLASAGNDGKIKLWTLDGQELQTFEGHDGSIWSLSFSPDGEALASAGDDGKIKLWTLDGQELQTFEGHDGRIWKINFSPDGKKLISAGNDRTARVWSLVDENFPMFDSEQNSVESISFSPDGQTLLSAGKGGNVQLWSLSEKLLKIIQQGQDRRINWISNVQFSPDGTTFVSSGNSRTFSLYRFDRRKLAELRVFEGHGDLISRVSFSPDGKILASSSHDNTVKIWDLTGQLLCTAEGHKHWVNDIQFSPNGETFASGSRDGTIKIWDLDCHEIDTFSGHGDGVWGVSFSPDGKTLASGSGDGTIKLWRSRDGQELETLEGHSNSIWGISYSPDGKLLASGSGDGTVKLWTSEGKELHTFTQGSSIKDLEFQSRQSNTRYSQ